jgi:hypothetical protein
VGVLTAVLGGGYLLWLMHRRRGMAVKAACYEFGSAFMPHPCKGQPWKCRGIARRDLALARPLDQHRRPQRRRQIDLLKVLAGLLPHSGTVTLLGQPLAALPGAQRAQQLAWLGQNESRPMT